MREIKFRAFVKLTKEIFEVGKIDLQHERIYKRNHPSSYYRFDDVELMQYIALKDKNDVEIYEGDIVKVDGSGNNDAEINEVVFYRGTFCFTNRKKLNPLFAGLNYCCEVIGNIYDNPELLEVEND